MKKFLVFVCILCLTLGLGVPALAVDDGGEITLPVVDIAPQDELIGGNEPVEEITTHPITATYVFVDSWSTKNVLYSTSGNTQEVGEGEFFYVNGYNGSYAFSATIPGCETMIWRTQSIVSNGAIVDGNDNCSGTMGASPVSITFYYTPFEDTIYVDHYCDDVLVETNTFVAMIGKTIYGNINTYDGFTIVNDLVGGIVPMRYSGVAPLHIRMDYHSANYTPTPVEPEPDNNQPTPTPAEEKPTPTPKPEEPTPTPKPEEPIITPAEEEPIITPEPEVPADVVEEPTPTPEVEEPTPAPAEAHLAPLVVKQTTAPAQTAEEPTAGWSPLNLLLALGSLGIGYALIADNKRRYDGLIIGALALAIFFMNVASWATLVWFDMTTIILAGVLILNGINYFLRDKEPRF